MKSIFNKLFIVITACSFFVACEKDEVKTVMTTGIAPVVTLAPATVVLTSATAADTLQTISWSPSDYGYSAAVNYVVQIAKGGANFAGAQQINMGSNKILKLTGNYLNSMAVGLGVAAGSTGQLDIRVKSSVSDSVSNFSDKVSLTVTTYKTAYPALLVKGGNAWVTPATRTNGYLLTSPNYDGKYEGYLYFPNADGYGGDAFQLVSSTTGTSYTWGGNSTVANGVSTAPITVGTSGNLWFTPAPNYMKVNSDINALTVSYIPVNFFISGDDNNWSTSATPMTLNTTTKQLVATNVSLTAGKKFVFTSNGSYDISYKVDADKKLIFAGPPAWAGDNITVPATGVFTVTLDLSEGAGGYTYSIK